MITGSSIKRILYFTLVTITAFLLSFTYIDPQSHWLILSALSFALITTGYTFGERVLTIIFTGLAAACLVQLTILINTTLPFPIHALFIFLTIFIGIYFTEKYKNLFFTILLIIIFTLLPAPSPLLLSETHSPFIFICLGLFIALIYQLIFFPYFIRSELRNCFISVLCSLKNLNTEIFACLLAPEYPDNIYLYERRIHKQKNLYMCAIEHLRNANLAAETKMHKLNKKINQERLTALNMLYANMMDYAQIRRRVTDHTTFSVCSQECKQILQEMDKSLIGLVAQIKNKKFYANTVMLDQKINALDNHYQHVLQIASREPLVFLLFIESLKNFSKNINAFHSITFPKEGL